MLTFHIQKGRRIDIIAFATSQRRVMKIVSSYFSTICKNGSELCFSFSVSTEKQEKKFYIAHFAAAYSVVPTVAIVESAAISRLVTKNAIAVFYTIYSEVGEIGTAVSDIVSREVPKLDDAVFVSI